MYSENSNTAATVEEEILLDSKVYFLNKSKSKYVIVGASTINFLPTIRIASTSSKQYVDLSTCEWFTLLNNKHMLVDRLDKASEKIINNNLKTIAVYMDTINNGVKVLKIKRDQGNQVVIGMQSMNMLWNLSKLINYRIQLLSNRCLQEYYRNLLHKLVGQSGNLLDHLHNLLDQRGQEENCLVIKELIYFKPDSVLHDINSL